jgi:hypothetical protein
MTFTCGSSKLLVVTDCESFIRGDPYQILQPYEVPERLVTLPYTQHNVILKGATRPQLEQSVKSCLKGHFKYKILRQILRRNRSIRCVWVATSCCDVMLNENIFASLL